MILIVYVGFWQALCLEEGVSITEAALIVGRPVDYFYSADGIRSHVSTTRESHHSRIDSRFRATTSLKSRRLFMLHFYKLNK